MRRRMALALLLLLLTVAGVYVLTRPCLYIQADGNLLRDGFTHAGDTFSLHFIHSVQKTPVTENFRITATGQLELESTVYQSFGVGLPFLASDGKFAMVGNKFVMQDMERIFPRLSLRTGPEARLTLYYQGREWAMYRELPAGTKVDIYVAPFYARWLAGAGGSR